jgi:hypothetical protein
MPLSNAKLSGECPVSSNLGFVILSRFVYIVAVFKPSKPFPIFSKDRFPVRKPVAA